MESYSLPLSDSERKEKDSSTQNLRLYRQISCRSSTSLGTKTGGGVVQHSTRPIFLCRCKRANQIECMQDGTACGFHCEGAGCRVLVLYQIFSFGQQVTILLTTAGIDAIYSAGAEQVDPTACRTKFSALMKMIPVWRDTLRRVWLKTAVLSLRCRPGANGIEG